MVFNRHSQSHVTPPFFFFFLYPSASETRTNLAHEYFQTNHEYTNHTRTSPENKIFAQPSELTFVSPPRVESRDKDSAFKKHNKGGKKGNWFIRDQKAKSPNIIHYDVIELCAG